MADLICDDNDCERCGARAARISCDDCGASGVVTDCGHREQPRPIAASQFDGRAVCEGCEDARRLAAEMRRVFGEPAAVTSLGGGLARVGLESWAQEATYRTLAAARALRGFADGHGADAAGDAAVCSAIEAAGALVAG